MARKINWTFEVCTALAAGALTLLAVSCNKSHAAQAFDPKAACTYADNVEWKHWGGAPYGPTAEEALADPKLDWYLKCSTAIPEALKPVVKAAIRANPKGEKMAYLTPDMTLLEMASGPDHTHRTQHLMRNVKVARIVEALGIVHAAETPIWSVKDQSGATLVVGDPFRCGNLSVIRILPAPPVPPPLPAPSPSPLKPIAGGCPNVYHLKVYVYQSEAMKLPGVAQTAAKEELEEHFVYGRHDPEHVSRTHYTQFQKALAAGELRHSVVAHVFRVSLIMTPEARGGEPTITAEEILGDITVKDTFYEIPFTLTQLQKWDAIRVVPVEDGNIISPPRYHKTGLHEMRFFNRLPNTKLGEWDSNPDPDCVMGEAWIERTSSVKDLLSFFIDWVLTLTA